MQRAITAAAVMEFSFFSLFSLLNLGGQLSGGRGLTHTRAQFSCSFDCEIALIIAAISLFLSVQC